MPTPIASLASRRIARLPASHPRLHGWELFRSDVAKQRVMRRGDVSPHRGQFGAPATEVPLWLSSGRVCCCRMRFKLFAFLGALSRATVFEDEWNPVCQLIERRCEQAELAQTGVRPLSIGAHLETVYELDPDHDHADDDVGITVSHPHRIGRSGAEGVRRHSASQHDRITHGTYEPNQKQATRAVVRSRDQHSEPDRQKAAGTFRIQCPARRITVRAAARRKRPLSPRRQ